MSYDLSSLYKYNIERLARKKYSGDLKGLRSDCKKRASDSNLYKDKEINTLDINIRLAFSNTPTGRRKIRRATAVYIEKSLNLGDGFLSREKSPKSPAYVLLECESTKAEKLANAIISHPIVDEVAVIVGDSDVFIRLYGTQMEIKYFLLDELNKMIGKNTIKRTKTYFSFEGTYHLKYPPKHHPYFNNSDNLE